jgi:hypothetical protein
MSINCKALFSDQFAMLASGLWHVLTTQAVKTTSQLELRNVFVFAAKTDTRRIGTSDSAREQLVVPIRLVSDFAANTRTFLSSSWDVVLSACVVRLRIHIVRTVRTLIKLLDFPRTVISLS